MIDYGSMTPVFTRVTQVEPYNSNQLRKMRYKKFFVIEDAFRP